MGWHLENGRRTRKKSSKGIKKLSIVLVLAFKNADFVRILNEILIR